jgi:hypothetical protein
MGKIVVSDNVLMLPSSLVRDAISSPERTARPSRRARIRSSVSQARCSRPVRGAGSGSLRGPAGRPGGRRAASSGGRSRARRRAPRQPPERGLAARSRVLLEGEDETERDQVRALVAPGAYVRNVEKVRRRSRSSSRGWHYQPMQAFWLSLLFGAPWLMGIAYVWSRAPRMNGTPPSMADRARQRLWTT